MGTILRTALAADVEEVLLTPNCVDCFSPKVVRAAAGAHVALPLAVSQSWAAIAARIQAHCQGDQHVLLAEAGSSRWYYEQDLHSPFALIIGNEAHGPSPEARNIATASIAIPLANNVESLNAAMATGIILYEALRQSPTYGQFAAASTHIRQERAFSIVELGTAAQEQPAQRLRTRQDAADWWRWCCCCCGWRCDHFAARSRCSYRRPSP